MARQIKGITIEIDGNVAPLQKALKSVNTTTIGLQGELKQVEKLLKLDPGNTELVAQKQKILADAIDGTSEKLKLLENASERASQQLANGDIGEEDWRKLQREIIQTKSQLEKFENELSGIDSAGSSIKKVESKTDDLGESFDKTEDKLDGLKAGMAAAGSAMIASVGAIITETEELRTSLSFLELSATNAGIGTDYIKDALVRFSVVSEDAGANTEALANLMASGFDTERMTTAISALSGAVIKFPDTLKIESLADGIQETLATGEAAGAYSELLARLGVNVDDFNITMSQLATEADKQDFALNTLVNEGLTDLDEQYRRTNDALVKGKESTTKFTIASAELGETLAPILTDITSGVTALVTWFNELDPAIQEIVLVVGGLTAALLVLAPAILAINVLLATNPVILIIMAVIAAIGLLIAAGVVLSDNWDSITDGMHEMFVDMADGIAGAIDGIVGFFEGLVDFIGGIFTTDWSEKIGFLGEPFNALFINIGNIFGDIKSVFTGIIDFVKGVFSGDLTTALQGISDIFAGIFGSIADFFKIPFNGVIGLINTAIGAINKINIKIPNWVPKIGGERFGFDIDKLEYLAEGGIVTRPTLAMVGENPNSAGEAVMPIEKIDGIIASALKKAGGGMGGEITIHNVTTLDGRVISDAVSKVQARDIKRLLPV